MTCAFARFAFGVVSAFGILTIEPSYSQVPPSMRPVPAVPSVQPLQPLPPGLQPGIVPPLVQPAPGAVLPGAGSASGQVDAGFGGPDQPRPPIGPRPGSVATFDPSLTFVPPNQLGIVDRYIKEKAVATQEAIQQELTTITVTPEGRVETEPARPEDVQILLQALQRIEANPSRTRSLITEADSGDLGIDEGGGSVAAESVIGQDTRTQVTATTTYPFRVIGRIDVGCTGTLIGPRHVLTAGHCVYNINNNQWYSNLNFSPGQNGNQKPYGTISWARAISVTGWTQQHLRDYDYAMIVLRQDIGNNNGWLGYGWQNPMPSYNININGYPGDKPTGTMWHAFCGLQIIQTFRLYYACDTFGGMSGSGVYVYKANDQSRIIYGIHAYGVDSTGLNGATRITQTVFNKIKEWKQKY